MRPREVANKLTQKLKAFEINQVMWGHLRSSRKQIADWSNQIAWIKKSRHQTKKIKTLIYPKFQSKNWKNFWGHLKVTEMAIKSIGPSRASFCLNQKLETKAKLEVIRGQASKMLIGWDQMTKIFSLRARKFFSRHKKPNGSHNNNNNDTSSSEFFENNKKWKQQNVKRQDDLER